MYVKFHENTKMLEHQDLQEAIEVIRVFSSNLMISWHTGKYLAIFILIESSVFLTYPSPSVCPFVVLSSFRFLTDSSTDLYKIWQEESGQSGLPTSVYWTNLSSSFSHVESLHLLQRNLTGSKYFYVHMVHIVN